MRGFELTPFLILILSAPALGNEIDYPIEMDFGSPQLCQTAAANIDLPSGSFAATLSVSCNQNKMIGTITTQEKLPKAQLRIAWPSGDSLSCEKVLSVASDQHAPLGVHCVTPEKPWFIPKAWSTAWIATIDYSLGGGRDVNELQKENFAARDKQVESESQTEDDRICDDAITHPDWIDGFFLAHLNWKPCRWRENSSSNPAASDTRIPNKEPNSMNTQTDAHAPTDKVPAGTFPRGP